MPITRSTLAAGLLLGCTAAADATVLTFDVFTDPAKTTFAQNNVINQGYGDNVTDFDPAGPVNGKYVRYGSGGGATPNVAVSYRYWYIPDPTDPNPGVNGETNGYLWNEDYGDLTNVIYDNFANWLTEVRFTAAPGYQVTLESFDIAAWPSTVNNTSLAGMTVKAVTDANSPGSVTLWSAGPDGAVLVRGDVAGVDVHDHYTPNVTVQSGTTLSLLYGDHGNLGIDNIRFSQSLIPEPASLALLAGAMVVSASRRRPRTV
jgi:hypothetical protein